MFVDQTHLAAFRRIAAKARLQRFGGDCYAYCMLALGQIDLVVEDTLQPYDIVPLIPIIEAAGGVVTDAGARARWPADLWSPRPVVNYMKKQCCCSSLWRKRDDHGQDRQL